MFSDGTKAHGADWRALYPFASHWADLPSGRIHYLDERPSESSNGGAAPTLLFIHGNPTWSFHWRRLIAALRSSYRCVAPDHLGCGLSAKPNRYLSLQDHIDNTCNLIDRLNVDRISLIAQDWGGAIGLGALLRMPERLERIVLFNTGAFPPRYIPWRIRACRLPVVGQLAVQGANLFSRAALRMTLARHRRLEPAIAAGYLAPYDNWANRRAVYGFVRDIPGSANHATWSTLQGIERGASSVRRSTGRAYLGDARLVFSARLPGALHRCVAARPGAPPRRRRTLGGRGCAGRIAGHRSKISRR